MLEMVKKLLQKCDHEYTFICDYPYSAIAGFGQLECIKCGKTAFSWSAQQVMFYKIKKEREMQKINLDKQKKC